IMEMFNQVPDRVVSRLLMPYAAEVVELAQGGLSSSSVFRCQGRAEQFCLRKWSGGVARFGHIQWIQSQIARAIAVGVEALPAHFRTVDGESLIADGDDVWELTEWKPGVADYLDFPSQSRLLAATRLLARFHSVFEPESRVQVSPAMEQRLQVLGDAIRWAAQVNWRSTSFADSLTTGLSEDQSKLIEMNVQRTHVFLRENGERLHQRLQILAKEPIHCHFVLRDVWSDHLLYSQDEVTGMIDFGAARIDEPATDVARLLGSLEPVDVDRWMFGFEGYRSMCPAIQRERVVMLDQVSTLLSANQWRIWVTEQQREFRASLRWQLTRWKSFLDRFERFDWLALG
ncbi:MAG: phosphotransferase, partial [Planctomycetota bacterium]